MLDYMILDKLRNHHAESYYHSLRVSQLCFQVANNVGMDLNQCISAVRAGLLHVVGKLRIPAHILSKSGPLSHSENEFVQKHVELGVVVQSSSP
jgi:HD-GYP domain-containing protein (c-di-GMP phosphodiesterase class II)